MPYASIITAELSGRVHQLFARTKLRDGHAQAQLIMAMQPLLETKEEAYPKICEYRDFQDLYSELREILVDGFDLYLGGDAIVNHVSQCVIDIIDPETQKNLRQVRQVPAYSCEFEEHEARVSSAKAEFKVFVGSQIRSALKAMTELNHSQLAQRNRVLKAQRQSYTRAHKALLKKAKRVEKSQNKRRQAARRQSPPPHPRFFASARVVHPQHVVMLPFHHPFGMVFSMRC